MSGYFGYFLEIKNEPQNYLWLIFIDKVIIGIECLAFPSSGGVAKIQRIFDGVVLYAKHHFTSYLLNPFINPKTPRKHNTSVHAFSEKQRTHDELADARPDLYNKP